MNILKGISFQKRDQPSLFAEPAEQNLYQSFLKAKERIELHLNQKRL